MEYITLLKENIKGHKSSLAGVFILVFIAGCVLSTALTIWSNSGRYILSEIRRGGFGDLTAWVSDVPNIEGLKESITDLSEVKSVDSQELIYADYSINDKKSDSKGQLITFVPNENYYRFFNNDLSGYSENKPQIASGEVYISASMLSVFDAKIGDKISFLIARGGKYKDLTVKGYYEDPFMGSSMIGMKGFLISEKDRMEILKTIETAGIDALASDGAMVHIFKEDNSNLSSTELTAIINNNSDLPLYTEFLYSENVIYGFMLILQNIFCGFFAAFALVLMFTCVVVLGHSINSNIEADFANMGILKTIGFTSKKLRLVQLIQYIISIVCGMLCGIILSAYMSDFVSKATLTTTGVLIPTKIPVVLCIISFAVIILLMVTFIIYKTNKIISVTPIKVINNMGFVSAFNKRKTISVCGKHFQLRLALRQVTTAKSRYAGICIVAALLVFLASLAGRMDSWLGADGKGLMDAFNPAEHHIGVQGFGSFEIGEAENIIAAYTDITDHYMLAMPSVSVNGIDCTANVITQPERFHILEGKTCNDNEVLVTEVFADDMGVSVGDTIKVGTKNNKSEYIVSGIYQCANEMGNNIGMSRDGYLKIGENKPEIWCHHYFLSDPSQRQNIIQSLEDAYGGDVYIHENSWPGLYGIINAMDMLILFIYLVAFVVVITVNTMAVEKIIFAEQKDLGVYKVVGFSAARLRVNFALRFGITAAVGSLMGTVFAAVLTDPLVSEIMRRVGIGNFESNPPFVTVIFPMTVVVLLFMVTAYCMAGKIKRTRSVLQT